jgi:multidrug efflux pump subunit AcrA (membrane-fusion protein)
MKNILAGLLLPLVLLASCRHEPADEEEPRVATPVTITAPNRQPLADAVELTAVSVLTRREYVKAPVAAYVAAVKANIGDMVKNGSVLFTLRTKEAAAIGNNKVIDSLLNFSGLISIRASKAGRIDSLVHQEGDYVQEGEFLAVISEGNSLVFMLNVPFELRQYIKPNSTCDLLMPDGQVVKGTLSQLLSSVDPVSQTLNYIVRPASAMNIPENLRIKVRIEKSVKNDAVVLPKEAVLSNETLTEFWIMKMINDSTAVKVPVKTGIENGNEIEIIEPALTGNEKILLTGQYGLPDTALVTIEK